MIDWFNNKKGGIDMKKFEEQLTKFYITNDKLKMEISLKDLVFLFENCPNNMDYNGNFPGCKIKRGKRQEFGEYVVRMLLDDAPNERDTIRIGEPFDDIFEEIMESCEDFCQYPSEDGED